MSNTPAKVLVLDADMTPALAVVRSLGRLGLSVDTASHALPAIAQHSRFANHHRQYPDPLSMPDAFNAWVCEQIEHQGYRLVFPVTERSATALLPQLDSPGLTGRIALPPRQVLEQALDKDATLALAKQLEIPTPGSWLIADIEQLTQLPASVGYPLVVKPARSIGDNGQQRQQLSVAYAHDAEELQTKVRHYLLFGEVLIQQYIRGDGVGIELIADQGEIKLAFQHKRLHEVPLTGGGSSLRESVPINSKLLDAAEKLMAAMHWHGVAMVEFKHNPADDSFALMEINGRFWGSLPLSVAAGADFPALLYRLLTEGNCGELPTVKTGTLARKLSADLHWAELVLRRVGDPGIVRFPPTRQIAHDWLSLFSLRHHFDVQQWRDPWPGLIDLGWIMRDQFARIGSMVSARRQSAQQKRQWQRWLNSNQPGKTSRLLFLCYGNINRSALAQQLFEQQFTGLVAVESAGFHPKTGRPADPVMQKVAAAQGIDLSHCRSQQVNDDMLAQANLVLVMEHAHRERLLATFPQAADKTLLLGLLPDTGVNGEIADPYGQPVAQYEHCFAQLQACSRALATHLKGQSA